MLILLSAAIAGPFDSSQIVHSMDFTYTWSGSPGATGTTNFDFITGAEVTPGIVCPERPTHCLNGAFITGNNGEGTYRTRLEAFGCTGTGFFPIFGSFQCNTRQTLNLDYTGTGAVYDGTASLGIVDFDIFLGFVSNVVFTDNNLGIYTGTLSGPGTGTFTE